MICIRRVSWEVAVEEVICSSRVSLAVVEVVVICRRRVSLEAGASISSPVAVEKHTYNHRLWFGKGS